jgi:hypothetical protein
VRFLHPIRDARAKAKKPVFLMNLLIIPILSFAIIDTDALEKADLIEEYCKAQSQEPRDMRAVFFPKTT